jgi:thioredoxin reductase
MEVYGGILSSWDIGIIGAGVSGVFAALRLAKRYKHLKVVVFEFGPPPPNCLRQDPIRIKRRRRQLEGWLGCFPTGDGKIYLEEDFQRISSLVDGRRIRPIKDWFTDQLNEVGNAKIIKPKQPSVNVKKAISNKGFDLNVHSYEQWIPDQIHQLAKISAEKIEAAGNVFLSFDTEVYNFVKSGRKFNVSTSQGDFTCKKLILNVGRTGWRWVNDQYKNLGILKEESGIVKYGVKVEMPSSALREFNKSHCSLSRGDLEIGPISWKGSVIQEDHEGVTIAAFRSNEERWKTDKVFFSVHKKIPFSEAPKPSRGIIPRDVKSYIDRIAQLSHCLSGERVGREKITNFSKGLGDLALMPEYNWIFETFKDIESIFPNLINRGYFHVPDIDTNINAINIANNLETEIEGLFVAGESAGFKGIAAAGLTGACAAEGAAK